MNRHEENKGLNRPSEEKGENMQTALSSFSHEMKNLLTLIMGNSRLLEQEMPSVASTDLWKSIQSDLLHMSSILQDMSAFRSLKLHCSLWDINAFLREVCENCGSWFDGTHRRLILACPHNAQILYADRNRLYQTIINLIKNGLEALGPDGTVSLLLRDGSPREQQLTGTQTAVIEIKDTGCGLTQQQLSQIFRPFYTTKAEGTGLGLPIARNITEAHGGKLLVSSHPGKGTKVTILLPRFPGLHK